MEGPAPKPGRSEAKGDAMAASEAVKEYRKQKRTWSKRRRKAIRPFKGLPWVFGVACVIAVIVLVVFNWIHETMNLMLAGNSYKVVNGDETAQYYVSDFESDEEREAYEEELVALIEAEGAALLVNEDDALPLASGAKVTLFSHSSVDLVYGGTGSGSVDTDEAVNLKDALEAAGFEVNQTMWDFYETGEGSEYERSSSSTLALVTGASTTYVANEVPWSVYTDEVIESVADYGDAAIVVLSRVGGEGADVNTSSEEGDEGSYLTLTDEEKELLTQIAAMKAEGTVDKIIVLINTSNALQVDFLFDESYDIDAALWIGGVGDTGATAVGQILAGEVNPSGSLVDTYLVDNYADPSLVNFGAYEYTNAEEAGLSEDDGNIYYVVYQEGIYVGYLYYETRYEDYVMGTGNAGDWVYSDVVGFSFGYGLSYTDFEWTDYEVEYVASTDEYVVTVTVTNVGDVAGKEVVQVYGQSPYTSYDEETGVEKASVELVGFGKTDELEPGESETVTVVVDGSDLASYDSYGYGTYILEAGTYYLTAARSAHAAVNNILAAKGYTPSNTSGRMDAEGDTTLVYSWDETELDTTTYSTNSATGVTIENQFDDADINLSSLTGDQTVTYLSRSDWEGTYPTEAVSLYATDEMVAALALQTYDADTYDGVYADAEMPTTNADNGVKAADLIGLDYDDELWDALLDQLSAQDMALFLGAAFHYTQPVQSIDLPGTRDENGPQGVSLSLFGGSSDVSTMATTSADVLGATFNVDLAYEVGVAIGNDALEAGIDMLYGPAANIHRTAYSGRNFEYYSEDGFLSGKIAAAECTGIASKGIMVALKHFALNDQETEREGLSTWANEQAIREVYLKAFEEALTETTVGVMTAYSRIGCTWAGANEGLLTGVLRTEWGNMGFALSDNSGFSSTYMNGIDSVLAGGGIFDAMTRIEYTQLRAYVNDPVVVSAMRDACHRVMYVIVNSAAMNGITSESDIVEVTPTHVVIVTVVVATSAAILALCLAMLVHRGARFRRANPKPRKKDFVD